MTLALRAAVAGALLAAGAALVARAGLTLDIGVGRRLRPLGPIALHIAAPPELVFDVIAAPYLGRTPRALRGKLEVIERGTDLVLAAHFTPVAPGLRVTTIETVRFERPRRVTFRLVKGPVPHVVEQYELRASGSGTAFESTAVSWAPTCGRSARGGERSWRRRGSGRSQARWTASAPRRSGARGTGGESTPSVARARTVTRRRRCWIARSGPS
jgi:hypothetical protein